MSLSALFRSEMTKLMLAGFLVGAAAMTIVPAAANSVDTPVALASR